MVVVEMFFSWNLTIIWVVSVALFVCYLLCRLRTYRHQTQQGVPGWSRKTPRENEILKFQTVAMETRNFSHSPGIGPMVLNFAGWSLLCHRGLSAKNQRNLPCGFWDSPRPGIHCRYCGNQDNIRWHDVGRQLQGWRRVNGQIQQFMTSSESV